MRLFSVTSCILAVVITQAPKTFADGKLCKNKLGEISVNFILQNVFSSTVEDKYQERTRTAVQTSGYKKVALNLEVLRNHNTNYTTSLVLAEGQDQKQSGRCWAYAANRQERDRMVMSGELRPDEDFSTAHLHFFNMLEKANTYLADVVELAAKKPVKMTEHNREKLNPAGIIADGGWFEYYSFLVNKYGLVPKQVMPETASSENTTVLLEELRMHAAAIAQKILDKADTLRNQKGKVAIEQWKELEVLREQGMKDIVEILRTHLGTPPGVGGRPMEFTYRKNEKPDPKAMQNNGKSDKKVPINVGADLIEYTPLTFARNFVKFNHRDYVTVSSYVSLEQGKLYEFKNSAIGKGAPEFNVRVLNTTSDRMLDLVSTSVTNGRSVWFGAAMGKDVDNETGIMHPDLFKRAETYGFDSNRIDELTKKQKAALNVFAINHAMTFQAVDRPDKRKPPIKLGVGNSWGDKVGTKGSYHMYTPWFHLYTSEAVIHKSFLTPDERALVDGKPTLMKMEDLY